MAKRPSEEDPRITDLARYRKARQQQRRSQPPRRRPGGEGFLGSNPRALPILIAVILLLVALYVLPRLH
jgi:hypothetical protein